MLRISVQRILVTITFLYHAGYASEFAAFLPMPGKRGRMCVLTDAKRGKNFRVRETGEIQHSPEDGEDYDASSHDVAAAASEAYSFQLRSRRIRKTLPEYSTLVLNADYQPLSFMPLSLWSWQDAIKAVFQDRVAVVENYDFVVRSSQVALHIPSVIALKDYVNLNKGEVSLTRRNLFLRDSFKCQYCGATHVYSHLTFDHVLPRSKGGDTNWENVVAACQLCNNKKADLSTKEIAHKGMRLIRQPKRPSIYELQVRARDFLPKYVHDSWRAYL